jgi:hypothetical protein
LGGRWFVDAVIAVETILVITLLYGLLHEFQANPLMDAWLAARFSSVPYLFNYWTLAGLSAILTVIAGTLITKIKRKQDTIPTRKSTRLNATERDNVGTLTVHNRGDQGAIQTQKSVDADLPERVFLRISLKDPYGALSLFLISVGILTLSLSLLVIRVVAMEALGLSCIVLGFTAASLPRELTGSRSMGTLLQGAMLDVEALLEPYPVQRAVYLPPVNGGPVSAFVPLKPNISPPRVDQMRTTPRRVQDKDQDGVLVFPVGAELATLTELQDGPSLDEALHHVLVESTELCSNIDKEERGDVIVVAMENVKVETLAEKYLSSLGSIPSSLAACVIAASYKKTVRVVDERRVGHLHIARFRAGTEVRES